MGFHKVAMLPIAAPLVPRQRSRALPVPPPLDPIIVTMVTNIHVSDTARMYEVAKVVLEARGSTAADAHARLTPDGRIDIGGCVLALMEECLGALEVSTGAEIGDPDIWLEIPGNGAEEAATKKG